MIITRVPCNMATARIYGEGRLRIVAKDEVHIHPSGRPDILISGENRMSAEGS
jgi:hypothetical protein